MLSQKKYIFSSAVYSFVDVLSRVISFLVALLVLKFISTADYALIGLALSFQSALLSVISFRGVIFRFFHKLEIEDRKEMLGTFWIFLVVINILMVIVAYVIIGVTGGSLLKNIDIKPLLPFILLISASQSMIQFFVIDMLQVQQKFKQGGLYALFLAFATASAVLVFVIYIRSDALGYLQGLAIANALVAFVGFFIVFPNIVFKFTYKWLKPILLFGLPLVPHFFAHWILSLSDRIILERYVSLDELGYYTFGYQVALALQLVFTSMNKNLIPFFVTSRSKDSDSNTKKLVVFYVAGVSFVAMLAQPVLGVLIEFAFNKYSLALPIIRWIIVASWIVALYYIPMNVVAYVESKTWKATLCTFFAASLNIIINLIFVPVYGLKSAYISTVIGYGALLLGLLIVSDKNALKKYIDFGKISKLMLIYVTFTVAAFWLEQIGLQVYLFITALQIICFIFAVFYLEIFKTSFFVSIANTLKSRFFSYKGAK